MKIVADWTNGGHSFSQSSKTGVIAIAMATAPLTRTEAKLDKILDQIVKSRDRRIERAIKSIQNKR